MNRIGVLGAALMVALAGCKHKQPNLGQVRSQIGEDPAAERDLYATIGQKTTVGNTEPIQIFGVGLVYKLAGTGSAAPAGAWRSMLENHLKKQNFSNLRELLEDPGHTTSLVLVTAVIPPGARKNDPLDVQITLPDESKTTSLKGGMLLTCDLVNSETKETVRAAVSDRKGGANGLLLGSVMAKAAGPVVAGTIVSVAALRGHVAADAEEPERPTMRVGRVWDGAQNLLPRPYYILVNSDAPQTVRMAMQIAERINSTFQASGDPSQKVAEAKTKELVVVSIPSAYRHNHFRFLLVARQVPLQPVAADSPYRRKLEDQLTEPATCLLAAIKLEALGPDSRRALRVGLESPSPWVRFAAAEALTYLGQTDGAAELARLAEAHPALRAHCLKALATMDDAVGTDRLVDLLGSTDAELRFGAFLALRLADPRNPAIRGQVLNHALKLHQLAPGASGLVHLTSDGRGEVMIFGDKVEFKGPFALPAGEEFTVTVPADEPKATVSRIVRAHGEPVVKTAKCATDVAAVLKTIAKLGGSHAEAVELLRRADRAQVLTAPLAIDAIPRQFRVEQLMALAKTDPTLFKADREVAKIGTIVPDAEASHDLPDEEEAKPEVKPEPPRQLSRDPGRLFGPRRQLSSDDAEPLPLPNPDTNKSALPNLNRDPGRILGSRKPDAQDD